MEQVFFILNGIPTVAYFEKGTTLLQYLRDVRCMKGTKEGCGTGHCGACTVLIDGETRRSCVTRMDWIENKQVLTIEGLTAGAAIHPIQKAFLDVGAVQCGFCTPGMILATKALLDKNPMPDRAQIMEGLAHNYCRCTGYVKIIEAVELAARRMFASIHPATDEKAQQKQIAEDPVTPLLEQTQVVAGSTGAPLKPPTGIAMGQALWDMEGEEKTKGRLLFTDDYELPGMLYGAVVWSGIAHGKIVSFDASQAEACPGVKRIFTWKDVPGKNGMGLLEADYPVFAKDEVHMIADVVALVVADTRRHATAAARKVKVTYEELPGIFTMEEAEKNNSLFAEIDYQVGDVSRAKEDSELLRVHNYYDIPRQEHACMEPESAFAYPKDGKLVVYATTQSPYELRSMLSEVVNLPEAEIQIVAPPLGGGFGKKCDPYMEGVASVAALAMNAPVKVTLSRKESLCLTTKRHPYKIDYEMGLKQSGEIAFVDAHFLSDGGAYRNLSPGVLEQSMIFSCGPYRIANGRVHGKALRTNNVLSGAFRGFGINQAAISIEIALDMAAEQLGISPFEIRLQNALQQGDITFTGQHVDYSVGIVDTLCYCEQQLKKVLPAYEAQYPKTGKRFGWGVASGFKNVGVGKGVVDDGGAIFTKTGDGRIQLRVSGIDMGQGFRTAMRQLSAEALHISPEEISVISGDTERTLRHGQAVSERQTLNSGRAVVEAAHCFLQELKEHPWVPGEERTAQFAYTAPKTYALHDEAGRKQAGENYRNYPAYAYTTQAALIEIDTTTGQVKVLKVISVHDVGRAINPHIIEGQIQGSCSMGIGWALTEHFDVVSGIPKQQVYGRLGLPVAADTPEYDLILVEDPDPEGPYGAKGISEVATVPVTPAVLNAINNAIGLRSMTLPVTPERILAHLKKA